MKNVPRQQENCLSVGINKTFDYLSTASSAIKGMAKKYKVGWPVKQRGWLSVFEPLVGVGRSIFSYPWGWGQSIS